MCQNPTIEQEIVLFKHKCSWASNFIGATIALILFCFDARADNIGYLFTKVSIDGKEYNFLVDNGVEITTIFTNRVKNANFEGLPSRMILPDYETYPFRVTNVKITIELVEIRLRYKLRVALLDSISPVLQSLNIDGIIGDDILSMDDWRIDFANKKISLAKKRKIKKEQFRVIDFGVGRRIPLTVQLPGGSSFRVLAEMDLGCHCYLNIWDSLALVPDSIRKIHRAYSAAPDVNETVSYIYAPKLTFENFHAEGVPVSFKRRKSSNLIGIEFFSLFEEIYLVYSERKIYLPSKKSHRVKVKKVNIYNGAVQSYIAIKGMPEPAWTLGQRVNEDFELKDEEDCLYFDVLFEDKKQ